MASVRVMRNLVYLMIVLVVSAAANGYTMQGLDIVVDYWAGSGSNECIVVIDWNGANGPYETSSHAWGYRWDGTKYVSDALAAIDTAGALNITTAYDGAFPSDAFYNDPSIDSDYHTSAGWTGWWYLGDTADGGLTWNYNHAGMDVEELWNDGIEGMNLLDTFNWTSETLTIPTPEPCTLTILAIGGLLLRKYKDV